MREKKVAAFNPHSSVIIASGTIASAMNGPFVRKHVIIRRMLRLDDSFISVVCISVIMQNATAEIR